MALTEPIKVARVSTGARNPPVAMHPREYNPTNQDKVPPARDPELGNLAIPLLTRRFADGKRLWKPSCRCLSAVCVLSDRQ
jgi:hypothetical protein